MRKICGAVILALMCITTAGAEYEAGQRAWDAGQRDAAIAEWQAGADAGEAKSMLALGRLYLQGLGVPQNYIQAHMWFNLAASRGEDAAMAERDALAAKLTPEALTEAQNLALAWDLRHLDARRYEHAARSLDDIGRKVGAWSKIHRAQQRTEPV